MPKQLTAAFVGTVTSPGRYNDEHGLLLRVVRSKKKQLISKSWVQRIVIQGRRRDLGLGGYPKVSLAEARERALENRRIARTGGEFWSSSDAPKGLATLRTLPSGHRFPSPAK